MPKINSHMANWAFCNTKGCFLVSFMVFSPAREPADAHKFVSTEKMKPIGLSPKTPERVV